jgi:ribA/ribD-fused uncharacterized protein
MTELLTFKLKITDFHSEGFEFLSNFFMKEQYYWGNNTFKSAEHAYQYQKAVHDADRRAIENASTPGQAKKIGRQIEIRKDWEYVKLWVMLEIIRRKFCNSAMGELLLGTGDAELIEGNTWGDTFWGVCRGKGENHLGKILMLVRDELREKE